MGSVKYKTDQTITIACALRDNEWGCAGVVCEAPEGSGRMMPSGHERSEGIVVIIRPDLVGATQTTTKKPGYYSH